MPQVNMEYGQGDAATEKWTRMGDQQLSADEDNSLPRDERGEPGAQRLALHAAIRALPDATAIYIRESWLGLGLPWETTYLLRREASSFIGTATFAVMGQPTLRDVPVALPLPVAHRFLGTLATVRPRSGPYRAHTPVTDDYPTVAICLVTSRGDVTFLSESQGPRRTPWAVGHVGWVGVTDSPRPARALAALRPHLRQDLLLNLLHDR
jgi:hypothetical protein